jgi:hypothetical protein
MHCDYCLDRARQRAALRAFAHLPDDHPLIVNRRRRIAMIDRLAGHNWDDCPSDTYRLEEPR